MERKMEEQEQKNKSLGEALQQDWENFKKIQSHHWEEISKAFSQLSNEMLNIGKSFKEYKNEQKNGDKK